jgi:hypothetical protein
MRDASASLVRKVRSALRQPKKQATTIYYSPAIIIIIIIIPHCPATHTTLPLTKTAWEAHENMTLGAKTVGIPPKPCVRSGFPPAG